MATLADLSQYASNMEYLERLARDGTLTRDNQIYKILKNKARNLPSLQSWFSANIEPYIS